MDNIIGQRFHVDGKSWKWNLNIRHHQDAPESVKDSDAGTSSISIQESRTGKKITAVSGEIGWIAKGEWLNARLQKNNVEYIPVDTVKFFGAFWFWLCNQINVPFLTTNDEATVKTPQGKDVMLKYPRLFAGKPSIYVHGKDAFLPKSPFDKTKTNLNDKDLGNDDKVVNIVIKQNDNQPQQEKILIPPMDKRKPWLFEPMKYMLTTVPKITYREVRKALRDKGMNHRYMNLELWVKKATGVEMEKNLENKIGPLMTNYGMDIGTLTRCLELNMRMKIETYGCHVLRFLNLFHRLVVPFEKYIEEHNRW
eukprot:938025_1